MIKIKKETFLSPLGVFFIYSVVSGLAIMGFRLAFPGENAPLEYFSLSWRLIRGLLDYVRLFPALALSSLVIPFGFRVYERESPAPFSPQLFKSLKMSIIAAFTAAVLFGLLFSLVLPLARDYSANLRFQGRLYRFARERAEESAAAGQWDETAQFVAVCERIWPGGPEIAELKIESGIHAEEERVSPLRLSDSEAPPEPLTALPGTEPVNAAEALALAETAIAEERYFDAHWLATLGGRLAGADSVEADAALRLAGRAWNGVNSLAPNAREIKAYNIFRLKRDGYQALLAEKWIQAYYTFLELLAESPEDPDAERYLAVSGNELKREAFFIDEIETAVGRVLTGAVFSLPQGRGRLVMRIASLSTSADSAYGIGVEILGFDRDGRFLWSAEAPYAKILPLSLGAGGEPGPAGDVAAVNPGVTILMRALHRNDRTKFREPRIRGLDAEAADDGPADRTSFRYAPESAQLALSVSWDNFLLLANIHRGFTGGPSALRFAAQTAGSGLSPADLLKAAENLTNYGYAPEVFEAELLRRFAEPLLLLPLGIFAIVIGWRYRALKRPRYMAIPMLGILPLVFNGAIHFFRGWIGNLGILAVVSLGFTSAAVFFGAGILVLLVLSLIILAAQHG